MVANGRRWLMYWGAWAALGFYMASMDALQTLDRPSSFLGHWVPLNLLQNLVMGLVGMGMLAMARHWPLDRLHWRDWRIWTLHFLGSLALAGVGLVIIWALSLPYLEPAVKARSLAMPMKALRLFAALYLHTYLLLMWVIYGAYHALRIQERYRAQELATAHLEGRLTEAQNQALRMQLQPHFLFNTLNSISALVHSDPMGADRMISRLASLLRMTLEAGTHAELPLRQELAFVDAYLAIETLRFQDRLTVRHEIDPACLEAQVPAFLLQPLVENAIKHGVADLARPCTITLRASREGDWLDLEVEDDGRGFEDRGQGIGTRNTEGRLALRFPGAHTFRLESAPGAGTQARIRLPYVLQDRESLP